MTRVYKYKKSDRINTDALRKYKKESGKSFTKIAEEAGEDVNDIVRWSTRKRVPRAVLKNLGLKARNKKLKIVEGGGIAPSGSAIFVCSVSQSQKASFLAVMEGLKISATRVPVKD